MSIGNIIQPLEMWPRHHARSHNPCYEGTHVIDPSGRGNGMVMRTIEKNAHLYEQLFERLMDTPVTGGEWNNYIRGTPVAISQRTSNPTGVDSFDIWLHQEHPGYQVYICNTGEMTGVEQDAFDEYHADSNYGKREHDGIIIGLMGAYYNDPEALQ